MSDQRGTNTVLRRVTAQRCPEQHHQRNDPQSGWRENFFAHVRKGNTCNRCQEEHCVGEGLQLAAVTKESMASSALTAKKQPRCLTSGRVEK